MFIGIIFPPHLITSKISWSTWRTYDPYLAEIAQINIEHSCFFNIFQWIIIKLGGNVCWLNPLAKFNNQPDPMKFSGVMVLELTQISTLSAQNLKQFTLFVGIISCPSLLTNLLPQAYRLFSLLSYYMPISHVYYYTGVFYDIWTLLFYNHSNVKILFCKCKIQTTLFTLDTKVKQIWTI